MSAAMELHVALSLRLDAIEAYRLAHAYRDEVLAADGQEYDGELAMYRGLVRTLRVVVRDGTSDEKRRAEVERLLHQHASDERAARAEKATAAAAPATPGLTIFRASHDSIVMGLYTTAAAAREHCEAEERRAWAKSENPTFDWIEDEEDGVAEMTAWVGGEECTTGYEVTALEVASEYDAEADE